MISQDQAQNTRRLIGTLRNMPPDFQWRFLAVCGCAFGVAKRLWPEAPEHKLSDADAKSGCFPEDLLARRLFGMVQHDIDGIFWGGAYSEGRRGDIPPEDVAQYLENWLAKQEVSS